MEDVTFGPPAGDRFNGSRMAIQWPSNCPSTALQLPFNSRPTPFLHHGVQRSRGSKTSIWFSVEILGSVELTKG